MTGNVRQRTQAATAFLAKLQAEAALLTELISQENGDWIVKGFIDVFRKVYTISGDTKVVSKLVELMLFPRFQEFASQNNLTIVPSKEQNHYPDLTFVDEEGHRFAVDLKSTYRKSNDRVNTMTLGAFTGYFRGRESSKNITYPYSSYAGHFVLGIIYSRAEVRSDEFRTRSVDELDTMPSVVRDLQFFVQPKFRIAKDQPGSGNTKNIGAVDRISTLIEGTGPFAELGEDVFDDYWMYYLTNETAKAAELPSPPYRSLTAYLAYKSVPAEESMEQSI